MEEYCLDTYALWEIILGNPKFAFLLNSQYVVTNWTLIELYKTLLREFDKTKAKTWCGSFKPFVQNVGLDTAIRAVDYNIENKKDNLSIFDCIGYVFALENKLKFVTGDKKFRKRENVLFIGK